MMDYRGPKLVPFDRKAVVRKFAKRFYKEISNPGVRNISFIVEREDGCWNVQSSHRDDSDVVETFRKAANALEQP
jgi:hypothetical protein